MAPSCSKSGLLFEGHFWQSGLMASPRISANAVLGLIGEGLPSSGPAYQGLADALRLLIADGRIVAPSTIADMVRLRPTSADQDDDYGLGFWLHARSDARKLAGYDPGVSLREGRDLRFADLYETRDWAFGPLVRRWWAEGRTVFAVHRGGDTVTSPWPSSRLISPPTLSIVTRWSGVAKSAAMPPSVTDRPAFVNHSVRRRTDFHAPCADASCRVL